jgi:hypothetical protein
MDNKMGSVDKKILEEINRYNFINKYVTEQAATEPTEDPVLGLPPVGGSTTPDTAPAPGGVLPDTPPPTTEAGPEVVDVQNDPEVEKLDGSTTNTTDTESGTEELDITDLVTTQKDMSQKQESYFDELFKHLENLENKLGEMDTLMDKVNSLESKLEKYRPKTPQEKLELRSLDSGPYNQKLTDFFMDKEADLEKSGKNEYVLTSDEVENYSPSEIKDTFNQLPNNKKNFGF